MADFQSLGDRLFYQNRREYTVKQGDVAYLDSTPLRRPFTLPAAQRIIAIVIVGIAVIIGVLFLNDTVFERLRQSAQAEQAIETNLARQASIDTVPGMASLMNRNDDEIRQIFADAGYTCYDASATSEHNTLILYKLPSDMTVEEAAPLYAMGMSNLTPVQASKLLNGSWRFDADRSGVVSMVVHYVDFSTNDPDIAVRNALEHEQLDPNSATDSGVDDSGNSFNQGNIDAEGMPCTWKISAVTLDEMYDITGMPDNGCYVGIRLTQQIQ